VPPAPNPHARRRNARIGPTSLPASGRKGPTPPWPLTLSPKPDVEAREAMLWEDLWKTPQAVAWERDRSGREVAMYVRWSVKAEALDRDAASEARQLADRLGLNSKALRALMWEIPADEVAGTRTERAQSQAARKSSGADRRHLFGVDGGAAG
jgi:hypothetical protein